MTFLFNLFKKYFLYIALFFFGLFYHISSSEFWPITISRTWLNPEKFEFSLLQKPLFGLFLGGFHLLPLSNVNHLLLVKIVFTAFGILSLYLFSKLAGSKQMPSILLLLSPVVLNNFFNIRTDQIAFLLFSLFLLLCGKGKLRYSLLVLCIIPLVGIKEIVFLLPGLLVFYHSFRGRISKKMLWTTGSILIGVLVWCTALNISSFYYLLESSNSPIFGNAQLIDYLKTEWPLLCITLLILIFNFIKRTHFLYSLTSLYFALILLLFPQSTSFFIASIAPFIYLPLLIFLNHSTRTFPVKKVLVAAQVLYISVIFHFYPRPLYHSNFDQFLYIKQTGQLLDKNNFSYLDGMGIFNKNKFIPCFVSPNDDYSNGFCISSINEATPDVIIVTSRLIHFGSELFTTLEKNYSQIFPNLWIKNDKITKEISDSTDLNRHPVPVFAF